MEIKYVSLIENNANNLSVNWEQDLIFIFSLTDLTNLAFYDSI